MDRDKLLDDTRCSFCGKRVCSLEDSYEEQDRKRYEHLTRDCEEIKRQGGYEKAVAPVARIAAALEAVIEEALSSRWDGA